MNLGVDGKLALVVGASKGIGRAVAIGLAAEGCNVIAVARDPDLLDGAGGRWAGDNGLGFIHQVRMDMMDAAATELISERALALGGPDIIYHCMGGSWDGVKAWDRPWAEWERVFRFNLGVAVDLNRLLVPSMIERKWGRVVMTSSDATKCYSGNPPYAASKFALEGYVRTVSKIWAASGVVLTGVAPGNVFTPGRWTYEQGPEWTQNYWKEHVSAGRWASDEEIARVILPLCGGPASFMPGAVVRVDGGSR